MNNPYRKGSYQARRNWRDRSPVRAPTEIPSPPPSPSERSPVLENFHWEQRSPVGSRAPSWNYSPAVGLTRLVRQILRGQDNIRGRVNGVWTKIQRLEELCREVDQAGYRPWYHARRVEPGIRTRFTRQGRDGEQREQFIQYIDNQVVQVPGHVVDSSECPAAQDSVVRPEPMLTADPEQESLTERSESPVERFDKFQPEKNPVTEPRRE